MQRADKKDFKKWVEDARNGDKRAFSKLYTATYDSIYFYLLSITANVQDAEDLTQTAYIRAMQSLNQLKDGGQFGIWLNRIAYNLCMDLFEKNIHLETGEGLEETLSDNTSERNPELQALKNDRAETVLRTIMQLPVKHRSVIMLKYYEGLRIREIAEVMDCSAGTVKSRLNAAKKSLHFLLKQQGLSTPFLGLAPALAAAAANHRPPADMVCPSPDRLTAAQNVSAGTSLKPRCFASCSPWPIALSMTGILSLGVVAFAVDSHITAAQPTVVETAPAAAVVSDIQLPAEYGATVPISISIDNPESVTSAYLQAPSGSIIPLTSQGGRFTAEVGENGSYTLVVQSISGEYQTHVLTVSTVDTDIPELLFYNSAADHLTVCLQDTQSGLDTASIYAFSETGTRITPESAEGGEITFLLPKEDCTVFYQDMAGNEGQLLVESEMVHPAP